jgi:hypothetical protein
LKNAIIGKKNLMDHAKGLSRYGGFSFKKRPFSTVDFSTMKTDFDPRPPPMENLNLLLAAYT